MSDYTLSAKITGDSSGFEKAFSKAKQSVDSFSTKISDSLKRVNKDNSKTLKEIASETGKTVNQLSEVMQSAADYQKAGMTKSDAMKKAYADIGYAADQANNKIRNTSNSMSDSFESTSSRISGSVSNMSEKLSGFSDKVKNIGSSISNAGSKLTKYITTPAIAATTALTGITLVKGFNRLTGIDDAQAKLKGLGHNAESVTEIMNSALASVKGTSYGMDEAATTAASAVAAGIKPGQELTRYLSLTADAAAIAGSSMSDMGSIINKVQTSQMAYTEDLNQLADRGLPIYQWLADEAGVTAGEVKKMASEGQISSEMFLNAIEKNIGGAAKIIGESSFKATISNIGASISRIGANFLDAGGKGGGFFSTLKPMLVNFNDKLGILEDKAADLGVKFGESFQTVIDKIKVVQSNFESLSPSIQDTIIKGGAVGVAIAIGMGPALKVLGTGVSTLGTFINIMGGIASVLIGPIGLVIAAISGLAIGFKLLYDRSEEFQELVAPIVLAFKNIAGTVVSNIDQIKSGTTSPLQGLQTIVNTVFSSMNTAVGSFIDGILARFPVIGTIISGMKNMFTEARDTIGNIFRELNIPVAAFIAGFIAVMARFSGPLGTFVSGVLSLGGTISSGLGGAVSKIAPLIGTLSDKLQYGGGLIGILKSGLSGLGGVISGLFSPVTLIVGGIALLVAGFATLMATNEDFRNTIMSTGQGIISSLVPAFQAITTAISSIVSTVMPVLISLFNQLFPVIGQVILVIAQVVAAIAPVISQLISALLPCITQIIAVIMNVVQAVMPAVIVVINVIIGIIQTLIPIITTIISVVASVVSSIVSAITVVITIIGNILAVVAGAVSVVVSALSSIFSSVLSVFSGIASTIGNAISGAVSIISSGFNTACDVVSSAVNAIGSFVSGLLATISSIFNSITSAVTSAVNRAFTAASNAFRNIVSSIQSSCSGIYAAVVNGFSSAISYITSLPGKAVQWGADFINGIASGIRGAISAVTDAVSGVAEKITSLLHFSRPDEGPLHYYERWMPDFMKGLSSGIMGNIGLIESAMSKVAGVMSLDANVQYVGNYDATPSADIGRRYAENTARLNTRAMDQRNAELYGNRTTNQTVNIYQPVKSPVETAREMKKVARELAYGF